MQSSFYQQKHAVTDSKKTDRSSNPGWKKRVLLDQIPNLLSPRILLLILLYSMAFTLLLLGFKMLHLEHRIEDAGNKIIDIQNISQEAESLLYQDESTQEIQQGISESIIRLHVIANSDTESDQELKLTVRNGIIRHLQSTLKSASTMAEARSLILSESDSIQQKAAQIIDQEGYSYPVTVSLTTRYFPIKVYGDLTFPAGDYEALCVEIGKASGRNWWCVLFPSLCFVDETCAVVPEDSKEKLQDSLSEEEYTSLEEKNKQEHSDNKESGKASVHVRSALLDWLSGD